MSMHVENDDLRDGEAGGSNPLTPTAKGSKTNVFEPFFRSVIKYSNEEKYSLPLILNEF